MKAFKFLPIVALAALVTLLGCKKDSPSGGQVETIAFTQETISLTEGESVKLSKYLTITPQAVADTAIVTWSMDKTSCATLSKSGNLQAIKAGNVTVTATAGGKSATCTVKITELPIESFTIPTTLACKENIPQELNVTVEPEGAYVGNIKFSFPEEEANSISCYVEEGKVYVLAKAVGTYHLTASYGELKDQTCVITSTIALIEEVTLTPERETMEKGETQKITLTVKPQQAKYGDVVTWKSSDESIATVEDGVVTSVEYGEVVISALVGQVAEGETVHTAKCTIRVAVKAIEKIEISETSITLSSGDVKQLSVTVTPSDAKYAQEIQWSSTNSDIAKVDDTGRVTGGNSGFATVTVKVGAEKEGEKIHTATCEVKVVGTVMTGTDQCGNTFHYGKIGSQLWMFDNMRCNQYSVNSGIGVTMNEQGSDDALKYAPYYIDATNNNNWQKRTDNYPKATKLSSTDIAAFGYAYNWAAAVGVDDSETPKHYDWEKRQGICPDGWHIPSYKEIETLVNTCGGKTNAGKYLKSTTGWYSQNGSNDFNFNALPAAVGKYDYYGAGGETQFWTITPFSSTSKDVLNTPRWEFDSSSVLMTANTDKNEVIFVRCVHD